MAVYTKKNAMLGYIVSTFILPQVKKELKKSLKDATPGGSGKKRKKRGAWSDVDMTDFSDNRTRISVAIGAIIGLVAFIWLFIADSE